MNKQHQNALIKESSPYLLQHAHNPVNWFPWKEASLALAQKENKLILISVGYAACHWCHVMEKESFEDEEVASIMNAHFVNIKVDREERPDIDQIYMDAVQLMTGAGGWPMNVIALPDGKPFWGGTYFRKNDWISYLKQIARLYEESPDKIEEYANNLSNGISKLHEIAEETSQPFTQTHLEKAVAEWSTYFDLKYGGPTRAPKFMMPVNFEFFLRYAHTFNDNSILEYTDTTLTKMAYGGVYDAVGGGFSRYSVDAAWHVPHFEKMLYDNGQLVSLYANAYKFTKNNLFERVIRETLQFVEKELMTREFGFYSSLDADSINKNGELEEGAFYVWTPGELQELIPEDYTLFSDYYNVNEFGHWEHGNYVLIRDKTEEEITQKHKISIEELNDTLLRCKSILAKHREKRPKPRLDDKVITSWNALMLKGYADAYKALGEESYRQIAINSGNFIKEQLITSKNSLFRIYKNGKQSINAYLEDYALCADAFIALYEISADESWILAASKLTDYAIAHFYDAKNEMFYFTSDEDALIVTRAVEKNDNVIPSSNSVMQKVLFKLARFLGNSKYQDIAEAMMKRMLNQVLEYPYSHANWLSNYMNFTNPFAEVVIAGSAYKEVLQTLNKQYIPNIIIAANNTSDSKLALFEKRIPDEGTLIYVCENYTCKLPVKTVKEALDELHTL